MIMNPRTPFPVPDRILNGLAPVAWDLWWSWQETQSLGCDRWAFGLPVEMVLKDGLTIDDLSWLLDHRLIETQRVAGRRRPNGLGSRSFFDSVLVLLTESGATLFEQSCLQTVKPHWDRERRILSVEGHPIKVYRQPSEKQEIVLCAFEEDGWVDQIDDPLPRGAAVGDQDAKTFLRKTVEHLNRAQHPATLHFSVAANGERVCWSFRHAAMRETNQPGPRGASTIRAGSFAPDDARRQRGKSGV